MRSVIDSMVEIGPVEVRTARSQIAFRRRKGFVVAWLRETASAAG